MNVRSKSVLAATLAALALVACNTADDAAARVVGHLYTLNNDGQANAVVVLDRRADGTLAESSAPATTGGAGLVVRQAVTSTRREQSASPGGICSPSTPAAIRLPCSTSLRAAN